MAATLPAIKNSTIEGTTIRKTAFTACTLSHVEIFRSAISGSTLTNVKLWHCTIDSSTLSAADLTNCAIVSSSLLDSKLHETKIADCSMDNCSMTSSPLAIRRFPPEIREMIFAGCIDNTKYKTPTLLVALRGDREIYEEAIQIFYRLNWFRVKWITLPDFELMSKKAIENIRKLIISARTYERIEAGVFAAPFAHCFTSVTMLSLMPRNAAELKVWAKACFAKFPNLSFLMIKITSAHLDLPLYPSVRDIRAVPSFRQVRAIFDLERNLGSAPRQYRVSNSIWEAWFWEAPKGQTLKWEGF